MAKRNSEPKVAATVNLNVRLSTALLNDFREAVKAEESNVSVELRRLMRERVAEHRAEREGTAA